MKKLILIMMILICAPKAISSGGVKCSDWVSESGVVSNDMNSSFGSSIQIGVDPKNGTVSEACRDAITSSRSIKGFPTIFSRYKLARTGDVFSPIYKVHKQTCKFRDCICNNCECALSKIKFSISNGVPKVSCGDPRDMWTYEVISDPADKNSVKSAMLCLQTYNPGDVILHTNGDKNTNNLPLVCAYTSFKDTNGDCLSPNSLNLIGCVDEPQKPAPPVYNPSIITYANPLINTFGLDPRTDRASIVANYLNLGSRFDAPVIQLTVSNPDLPYIPTLTLQAQFPTYLSGLPVYDRYAPMLPAYSQGQPILPSPMVKSGAVFPMSGAFSKEAYSPVASNTYTFYAKVPSSNPSNVCACLVISGGGSTVDFCAKESYVGCVPRPTIMDSGYALVVDNLRAVYNDGKYPVYNDSSNRLVNNYFATPIPNAQITFVRLDNNGVPLIFDKDGDQICKRLEDRQYYKCADGKTKASYPWSTLDDYYIANNIVPPLNSTTAKALSNRAKWMNENILTQPPVAQLGADNTPILNDDGYVNIIKAVFEYRPLYDLNDSYPFKVNGYEQDILKVYGVNFASIIPQMSRYTNQPVQVKILTPELRQNLDYCNAYSSGFSLSSQYINQLNVADKALSYYVPAGTRWRGACRGKQGCVTGTMINGSAQDCSQSTSDIAGTTIKSGNFFLCDPYPIQNNYTSNCCIGPIPNNFNFITPNGDNTCPSVTGQCSAVVDHDAYAESIVCPGVYTTEVASSFDAPNRNTSSYYQRPNPSDLRVVVNSNMISENPNTSFPVSANNITFPGASSLTTGTMKINSSAYNVSYPGPIPTVSSDPTTGTRTVLNTIGSNYQAGNLPTADPATNISYDIDSSTGVVQASSICVYSPDYITDDNGAQWNPIGYSLNSPSDGFRDDKKLNAYLCDHIKQMCKTITPYDSGANTGYATWPRSIGSVNNSDATVNGSCNIGYSTADGTSTIAKCNDGWVMSGQTNSMATTNTCLSNCIANYREANFTTSSSNLNYSVTGAATTFMNDGATVAVANGAISGTCTNGYHNASGGVNISATCSNGVISPPASSLCMADCPAGNISGTNIVMNGGSNGVNATGTCMPGYAPGVVSGIQAPPSAMCSNGKWVSANDSCVPSSCPDIVSGNANFSSVANGATATASSCSTGYVPSSTPSSTVIMPTMQCLNGAWQTPRNPCVQGCSGFMQDGSIFPDLIAGNKATGWCSSNYFGANGVLPSATCGSDGKWTNVSTTCGNAACYTQTIGRIKYDNGNRAGGTASGSSITGTCPAGYSSIYVDASYSVDGTNYYYVNSGQKVGVGAYSKTSTSYIPSGVSGAIYNTKQGLGISMATKQIPPIGQCQNGTFVLQEGGCELPCYISNNSFSSNRTIYSGQYAVSVNCNNGYRMEPTMYCSNGSIVQSQPPAIPSGAYFDRCSKQ